MGTRGAFGFRIDGADKITYNHFDSYPDGLGDQVVSWVESATAPNRIAKTIAAVKELRFVTDSTPVTADDIEALRPFTDMGVGRRDGQVGPNWYQLLREAQPSCGIDKIVKAGVMLDGHEFLSDSLFCEYAYVVNFDENVVEFYSGFQGKRHNKGRYHSMPVCDAERREKSGSVYYPVALVGTRPFDGVRMWKKTWIKDLFPSDKDEE